LSHAGIVGLVPRACAALRSAFVFEHSAFACVANADLLRVPESSSDPPHAVPATPATARATVDTANVVMSRDPRIGADVRFAVDAHRERGLALVARARARTRRALRATGRQLCERLADVAPRQRARRRRPGVAVAPGRLVPA